MGFVDSIYCTSLLFLGAFCSLEDFLSTMSFTWKFDFFSYLNALYNLFLSNFYASTSNTKLTVERIENLVSCLILEDRVSVFHHWWWCLLWTWGRQFWLCWEFLQLSFYWGLIMNGWILDLVKYFLCTYWYMTIWVNDSFSCTFFFKYMCCQSEHLLVLLRYTILFD